jgi:hypothetical protein
VAALHPEPLEIDLCQIGAKLPLSDEDHLRLDRTYGLRVQVGVSEGVGFAGHGDRRFDGRHCSTIVAAGQSGSLYLHQVAAGDFRRDRIAAHTFFLGRSLRIAEIA